ncbi:hypothetical protein [Chryseobacterium sediminis]|uniref:hypothetical protein n=1 Tax=Chryseobacterium sediminis TaxID=1679494 RepID=UPI00285747E4|nr:hypothetical protein [Chryseobacterium sediminis]MDR6464710.1 hypothetical protein [Chryseobacterium sediminis]
MAKVNIEEIIDYIDTDIRKALSETLKQHFPKESFNDREVFRTFKKMIARKCSTWEDVPDIFVEKD